MIYNFNLGIGWASSGVEYAQAYRARLLRSIGQEARFVFTDMFPRDPLAHMTRNIGFLDREVIWLYSFFTDNPVAPVTYTLDRLEAGFGGRTFTRRREGRIMRYIFEGKNNFYTAYLTDDTGDKVHRVEMVSNGLLIRKDYFTDRRLFSEYYAPRDGKANLYLRRFFNRDGSQAYEEMTDGGHPVYRFPDRMVFSKEELVGRMVAQLHLTAEDVVIIDRTTGIGQAILQNVGPARVGVVIHAEHFSENATDDQTILWNNYYEYPFAQYRHIDFYITATEVQNRILKEQFRRYKGADPTVVTIPVGSIFELKRPEGKRRPHSLITASRLASEKHIDWIIDAVVQARRTIPDLTLDICGKGVEEPRLREQIRRLDCGAYVRLLGQRKMEEVYKDYEAYVAASTSEGFGLTLLEAVGSGLPIIGFDVRYGNQTFIDPGRNGYLIPVDDQADGRQRAALLADRIVELFTRADLEAFHARSYEIAKAYMTSEVEKKWDNLLRSK